MSYTTTVRVRYAETDAMGVVYHANYLVWLEIARCELMRSMGITYKSFEAQGVLTPVISVEINYMKPALYDDLLTVAIDVFRLTPVRLSFQYEVKRGDELLVAGMTHHAFVGTNFKPLNFRKGYPKLWKLFYQAVFPGNRNI